MHQVETFAILVNDKLEVQQWKQDLVILHSQNIISVSYYKMCVVKNNFWVL